MSLKLNIAANYAGQVYTGLVGIAMVPLYLRLMGAEAYGLVGFFTLLQAWSLVLDLGMSGTVSREAARHAAGTLEAAALRHLLRSLEWLFWPAGLAMAVLTGLAAPAIAGRWLQIQSLHLPEVELAVALMGLAIGIRWASGLYRGVITGLERQVWLNGFNSLFVSLRFLGVLPVMAIFGATPVPFFAFQALVSTLEFWVLASRTYKWVPLPPGVRAHGSWAALQPVLEFSGGIAVATIVWVFVTQADKLIISNLLPLAEYGFFTAAVMAASAITMFSGAVTQALLPRLTRLAQQQDPAAFIALYRHATELTAALAGPLTLALALFGEPMLWAWTGNRDFAARYAPVLTLYAIGNGFMALAAFPYYLQYARGNLRLHLWGTLGFALVLVPFITAASMRYGPLGAGWVWATSNALFFIFWSAYVHKRLQPGLHRSWLVRDVLRVLVLPCLLGVALAFAFPRDAGRWWSATLVGVVALLMMLAGLALSDLARPRLRAICTRLAPRMR
ncbi:MAG: oligosaccharide flippase family protein [Ramlibacter sp.]|nr:oligosaccharide flippase family protein [Ramlibacter sp.]